jgi:PAS domain S-box-containing protein
MGIIFVISIVGAEYLHENMRQAQKFQQQLLTIKQITELIHYLQLERGLSGGFIGSHGDQFSQELQKQRLSTDTFLSESSNTFFSPSSKQNLLQIRHSIDTKSISAIKSFDDYTKLISEIRSNYLAQVKTIYNFQMRSQLQAYTNLMTAKEAMGQMRGAINSMATKHSVDHLLFIQVSYANAEFNIAREHLLVLSTPQHKKEFESIYASPEFRWTIKIVDDFIQKGYMDNFVDPKLWFSRSTVAINNLYSLEKEYLTSFDTIVNEELKRSQMELFFGSISIFIITLFSLNLGYKISRDIEKNISLLDNYKQAVDHSSIVSKTTPKGIITYVNDEFCNISGFKKEELLGKPHNIVRHYDISKEAFQEMWRTILNKQHWNGVLKNKRKDGTFYWVNVTINPILDNDGNIEEFIAIHNDITTTVKLQEELEKTQEDMIMRLGEIGETRSLETGYHVRRVSEYSRILGKAYGLTPTQVRYLADASPMHDIGKIGIPDNILLKEGPLTNDEWVIMRSHCKMGYHFFEDSDSPLLKAAAIIAYEHHEKWDGSGYPRGLKGEDIHIYGRITAIADVFDALGSDRCYKKAWKNEEIFTLLRNESGKHFDPVLIELFFEHIDEILALQSQHNDNDKG